MGSDELTNCSISLVLLRNSTVHLSATKKMMMIAARTTTMMMMTMMILMTTRITVVMVMVIMIIMMTLTTTTTMKSQARQLTSRVTMVPRKLKKQPKKKIPSFSDALLLLCSPDYSLVDAYPTLCRVYAIAVAIPVSSSTTERSFSALKRVKLAFARPWFRKDLNRYFQCQSSVKFCLPLFFPFLAGGWGCKHHDYS